jgi:hypothetical protein
MPYRRVKQNEPTYGIVLLIAGMALPSILALIPILRIPFPALITFSILLQVGALIFGLLSWQRTPGKIVTCAAATLLILMGALVILLLCTQESGLESSLPE